jgi:hypothetical protein
MLEWRLVWYDAFDWEICHLLSACGCSVSSAGDAMRYDIFDENISMWNPVQFPKL